MSASPSGTPSAEEAGLGEPEPANAPDIDYYARQTAAARPHEPHPDCPDTLACLPDSDDRPQHTLPVILRCAILGSPRRRLTIREIYAAMEAKYPWYRTAGPTWKQSVRHHLSLNRLFEKVPRPATDPGFGSYWTCNLDAPTGTKRPRKRGKLSKAGNEDEEEAPAAPKLRGRTKRATPTTAGVQAATPFPADAVPPPAKHTPPPDATMLPADGVGEDGPSSAPPPPNPFGDGPASGPSAAPPRAPSPAVLMHSYPPPLPVHVVYATAQGVPGQPPPELAQVEILQAVVGRLSSELSTARWQAETLGAQVGRMTEELAGVRAAREAAEALLAEEAQRRVAAERAAEEQTHLRVRAEEELRAVMATAAAK